MKNCWTFIKTDGVVRLVILVTRVALSHCLVQLCVCAYPNTHLIKILQGFDANVMVINTPYTT